MDATFIIHSLSNVAPLKCVRYNMNRADVMYSFYAVSTLRCNSTALDNKVDEPYLVTFLQFSTLYYSDSQG